MVSYPEGPLDDNTFEWPYPINYGKEIEISADVLVIGGGLAGSHAAINAAKTGAKVVVVDKAPVIISGSGGAGIDHWHDAFTNPASKISPEEVMELGAGQMEAAGEFSIGHTQYISCKESYDALLDLEKMGMKIRDEGDEFEDAEFRDEESKLLFAYDYENKHTVRIQGAEMKPILYSELKRLEVEIHDRIRVTKLLTEGGKAGSRVVGATGFNMRTGEFYIFKSKSTILATNAPYRIWIFSTELVGASASHSDPNCTGDGYAMAWKAGAEFTLMERSMPASGGFRYPSYGTGNAHNTWYACTIVDANGKEIPWVDRDGKVLETVSERYYPAPGQRVVVHGPSGRLYEFKGATLIPDLPERIKSGEYVLPFYADLPGMPEHERRAIFGLMVGHEGKTRIPVYETYTQAGFDPDRDMLQTNVLPPDVAGQFGGWWSGIGPPQWRDISFGGYGGVVVDWDLRSSLEGLYSAGGQLTSVGGCAGSSTTGRYAGRKAAEYAKGVQDSEIDRTQVNENKAQVYAPVERNEGIGWKELKAGICRIMQDYCGEYKSEEILRMGLKWLGSIRESEGARVCARNPHELARTIECFTNITVGEMIIQSCLARKSSSRILGFQRLDYPENDAPEWNKFVTIRLENGEVKAGELPFKYWLLPPNAPTYEENYKLHCSI
ncbi:MAG: FAD-dependent oxidoreductase [Deltaproteobacteria bacterium]|nr:FAD-dependent oxidoreductase [Deltaproteobacteria bacterium]